MTATCIATSMYIDPSPSKHPVVGCSHDTTMPMQLMPLDVDIDVDAATTHARVLELDISTSHAVRKSVHDSMWHMSDGAATTVVLACGRRSWVRCVVALHSACCRKHAKSARAALQHTRNLWITHHDSGGACENDTTEAIAHLTMRTCTVGDPPDDTMTHHRAGHALLRLFPGLRALRFDMQRCPHGRGLLPVLDAMRADWSGPSKDQQQPSSIYELVLDQCDVRACHALVRVPVLMALRHLSLQLSGDRTAQDVGCLGALVNLRTLDLLGDGAATGLHAVSWGCQALTHLRASHIIEQHTPCAWAQLRACRVDAPIHVSDLTRLLVWRVPPVSESPAAPTPGATVPLRIEAPHVCVPWNAACGTLVARLAHYVCRLAHPPTGWVPGTTSVRLGLSLINAPDPGVKGDSAGRMQDDDDDADIALSTTLLALQAIASAVAELTLPHRAALLALERVEQLEQLGVAVLIRTRM